MNEGAGGAEAPWRFFNRYQFLGDDIKIICFCVLRLLHMSLQNKYGCRLNTNKIYDMINMFNRYI
jgi:hypothetical protein